MHRELSGTIECPGAKYAWSGNGKAGEGTMEILSTSIIGVKVDLSFIKPFQSDCITHFNLSPQCNDTNVKWTMDVPNTFMGKVVSLFMNLDKMIGKDFDSGLAALKVEAER